MQGNSGIWCSGPRRTRSAARGRLWRRRAGSGRWREVHTSGGVQRSEAATSSRS
uniref:Predicted protein n=1 Tax=Hordeum vulgare subsp. vulgare TaxID=112509 RepID=F2DN63_HORVV|nr:predicted protein [Hordeum vulgare subsp. vulgare]